MRKMLHAAAWFAWLSAALVAVSTTRNPLYLTLALAAFIMTARAIRHPGETSATPLAPGRFALYVIPLAALLNALLSRVGDTVLLAIPTTWPLIGGPITAEALVYGALNGLVLTALFTAFTVLNLAVPVRDLIRFIPRALYPVAVVASIAVTFAPATLRQMQQIREAQAIRGHRMRRLRDWLPLFMPLLTGGLERALQLAEAMASRGFADEGETTHTGRTQVVSVVGLLAILSGGLLTAWQQVFWGFLLIVTGSIAIVGTLWLTGRSIPHTTYRCAPWGYREWLVTGGALVAVAAFLFWGGATRTYNPYPALTWPAFDTLTGTALLGFLLPALVIGGRDDPL
ncbi:MAG: energy-coupling factor transporter transmembrane protein EcfT [Anaerolineae bacterium]|nr:energy-coupling factor transporter transmembrane protein EcfT [Anaerolineae bacterium]